MSNRILTKEEDVIYYLKRETGYSENTVRLVLDTFWKDLESNLSDLNFSNKQIILTGLFSFVRNFDKLQKVLKKKVEIYEKYEGHDEKIKKLKKIIDENSKIKSE